MIAPLLALLQLAAPPGMLTVRGAAQEANVPVVETNAGPAVRADLVAAPLGGRVRELAGGRYVVSFPGVQFDLTEQVPFARSGEDVVPLAAAPFTDDGKLYVPLQLVAESLPHLGSGVLYDAVHAELRLFTRERVLAASTTPALRVSRGGSSASSGRRDVARPTGARRRLVVVDAGHGGPDNGMTGPLGGSFRIQEKDITLAVSKSLAEALRVRGVDVLMTRTRDTLIALDDRGRIANQSRGDLFISVHVNAASPTWKDPAGARGFETYFLAEAKTEEARRVERMENEAVRFETRVEASRGDPLSFIMNDMAQNEHLRESSDLATTIQAQLGAMHPGPDRGVRQANFAVLRNSFMPAVLVEIGFGTNPTEASFLADPRRQRAIADAIAGAAVEYLAHYERRVGTGGR
jgi:N-acetylmuramoyl-L-alanine amidase